MAKSITSVSANNTFQVWLDKTNELVDLINNDVFTASPGGDTTVGNATLIGSLTANTVIANNLLRVDTVSPKTGSTSILATAPFNVTTNQTVLERLTSAIGPRISLYDGTIDWQVGFENSTNKNFIITSGGATTFRVTSGGNVQTSGSVTATSFVGPVTGNITGNVTGNVTGTVSSISNHSTTNLAEGTNLYFTNTRARAAIGVSGALSYNSGTGIISITEAGIRTMFSGGTGVTYNNTTGVIAIGQAVETTSNVTFSTLSITGSISASANIATTGNISAGGSITAAGDITAFGTVSDARKKENIQKIDNALDKVSKIGGYTFNYIGDDTKMTGVIAQELLRVLPEVVYEIDDEDKGSSYYAVRHGNIVGLLIEAIKELKNEIESLKGSR